MARYALVRRSDGHVVNVINWDGTPRWSPPEGHDVLPADSEAEPGASWDGARFTRQRPDPVPPVPTLEERIAALEARLARLP